MEEEYWGKCTVDMEPKPCVICKGRGEAPCRDACPVGIDVPKYTRLVKEGKFLDALEVIAEKVPFPSTLGHVCIRFCEAKCRRAEVDEPVAINALKRFVASSNALSVIREREAATIKSTDKRVAIIGSGPAGLTAAYYLAKLGHLVTVFEALPQPGGMMRFGIPDYRLPKEILDAEIEGIKAIGVDIRTNARVDFPEELFEKGYKAIFIAIGAHQGIKMGVEGEDNPRIMECVSFLREVNLGKRAKLGNRVAVIGGGNAALDSARTALRLGAKEVTIIYRRTRDQMPAYHEEIELAITEGVQIRFLTAPSRAISLGREVRLECIHMQLGEIDISGRRRPEPIEGSEFSLGFDTVISAIGQRPEIPGRFGLPIGQGNTIQVDPDTLATIRKGIFAGGDAITGPASVVEAIASGRKAAISVDRYLGGSGGIEIKRTRPIYPKIGEQFDQSYLREKRMPMPLLPIEERLNGFLAVELGFDGLTAMKEANRCLMCDQQIFVKMDPARCVQCSICQLMCSFRYTKTFNPELAKIEIQPRPIGAMGYLDDCIGGCSLCIDSCLFGALEYNNGRK